MTVDIIIAEDEQNILDGLVALFTANGFRVIATAGNGIEAFEKIAETKCRLVVTDIKMPLMDELTLMKKCQELPQDFPRPKFIVITGFEKFEYAKEAVNLGALAFLSKISLIEDLNQIIETVKEHFSMDTVDRQKLKYKILESYINFNGLETDDEYPDTKFAAVGIFFPPAVRRNTPFIFLTRIISNANCTAISTSFFFSVKTIRRRTLTHVLRSWKKN